jgi:murein DD-endopeptidase MepM/ murein hydrolase activator NlpD
MPELPTLGEQKKSSTLIPVVVAATVVGLLAGGGYWLTHRDDPTTDPTPAVAAVDAANADGGVAVVTDPTAPAIAGAPTPTTAPLTAPTGPSAPQDPKLKVLGATVNGPLESAIIASAGKELGAPLTQVVNRSLVWWLRVPQDLVKGDTLAVIYEPRDGQEPLVHAVRFTSHKLGKTFEAWRYQPRGSDVARFFQTDGSELEERIVGGPLDSYEQITSLLRDGRKHKGVDFKTPVGTPVKATFDGTITRKNWNFRGNGNSVEIHESGGAGRSALYLHLSELPKTLSVGQRIKKGETFAKSGNTGHSFAPHLHYQLMNGDKVIDPFVSHKTTRISLPASERSPFDRKKAELDALLPATALAGG